ncbi:helix-turn-helix transcriptional regulator [Streptosporangium sp. V21-05]|uniref:helix-turn-helix transcriptional regulator n=1 Tax=Streptosporangium sp. V21-05 TaxID=3446115 RepID=UPI003F5365B7
MSRFSAVPLASSLDFLREVFGDAGIDEKTSARVADLFGQWLRERSSTEEAGTPRSVRRLLWRGRVDQAVRALRELGDSAAPGARAAGPFRDVIDWVSCWYPGLRVRPAVRGRDVDPAGEIEVTTGLEGMRVLSALLTGHEGRKAVARAEQVLRLCPMGRTALDSLTAALVTLIYADRADLARRWCEPLLEQTTTHCAPNWQGMFAAIRAETAVRQGRLQEAERCAHAALTHLPMAAWGVALGFPLAAMVAAKVGMGKYEDAARYLAVPVPEAMFETPVGLHYLFARGGYRLATGAPEAALADFRTCGDLMRGWDVDLPGIVAWRLGAAQACLDLGRIREARMLVDDQLAALDPAVTRTRGIATRLRAATLAVEARPAVLEEAVEILQASQDRFELALVLAELGRAHSRLGESHRARAVQRRARHIASTCGAGPLTDAVSPSGNPPGLPEGAVPAAPGLPGAGDADLSDAERRVATLASQGYTNRQISGKLYVTVSTVEQHLTHIYRKLGVSRRGDLPTFLD